eukprot:TRINITY_DN10658_c0_g1_i4.p1 TRINITY_DN10658_c0_g1~~TRINITY_DN10658_c0_g1_i4.p1  ORF type:complete len:816 (+),score=159.00 TRINITY_DN10658_c0_g1_i4:74-2449(+)
MGNRCWGRGGGATPRNRDAGAADSTGSPEPGASEEPAAAAGLEAEAGADEPPAEQAEPTHSTAGAVPAAAEPAAAAALAEGGLPGGADSGNAGAEPAGHAEAAAADPPEPAEAAAATDSESSSCCPAALGLALLPPDGTPPRSQGAAEDGGFCVRPLRAAESSCSPSARGSASALSEAQLPRAAAAAAVAPSESYRPLGGELGSGAAPHLPLPAPALRGLATRRLAALWNAAAGDVVDELCRNLRSADDSGNEKFAALAEAAEALQRRSAPAHGGALGRAELLLVSLYTMTGPDIDAVMGFPGVPEYSPAAAGDWAEYAAVAGDQRNGALCSAVAAAAQTACVAGGSADAALGKWVKTICLLLVLASSTTCAPGTLSLPLGGLSRAQLRALRQIRPGQMLGWPATVSCTEDATVAEAFATGAASAGSSALVRIHDVGAALPLQGVSKYPREREVLLPPLCLLCAAGAPRRHPATGCLTLDVAWRGVTAEPELAQAVRRDAAAAAERLAVRFRAARDGSAPPPWGAPQSRARSPPFPDRGPHWSPPPPDLGADEAAFRCAAFAAAYGLPPAAAQRLREVAFGLGPQGRAAAVDAALGALCESPQLAAAGAAPAMWCTGTAPAPGAALYAVRELCRRHGPSAAPVGDAKIVALAELASRGRAARDAVMTELCHSYEAGGARAAEWIGDAPAALCRPASPPPSGAHSPPAALSRKRVPPGAPAPPLPLQADEAGPVRVRCPAEPAPPGASVAAVREALRSAPEHVALCAVRRLPLLTGPCGSSPCWPRLHAGAL